MAFSATARTRTRVGWGHKYHIGRWSLAFLGTLAGLLIAARLYLPTYVRNYVNDVLDRNEEYDGSVGDVDIHLWRGAYSIRNVDIVKTSSRIPVPLFSSSRVEISLSWRDLWHGSFVGRVTVHRGKLNFARGSKDVQTGEEGEWVRTVKDLSPLRINRFEVKDSEVHYRDFSSSPEVDVYINELNGAATNLTNSRKISQSLAAHIEGTGIAQRKAPVSVVGDFDPFTEKANFSIALELTKLPVPMLNDALKAYAGIDAEKGEFNLYSESKAINDNFDGYAKILIRDLALIDLKKDSKNPIAFLWESIVAAVTEIFSNQRKDQIATRIPFAGTLSKPDTGTFAALGEILYNAFVEALKPGLESATKSKD